MNSFLEITSNDNWFKQHPEKIAGVEYETTSYFFPIMVKGTKEDVLRVTGISDAVRVPTGTLKYWTDFIREPLRAGIPMYLQNMPLQELFKNEKNWKEEYHSKGISEVRKKELLYKIWAIEAIIKAHGKAKTVNNYPESDNQNLYQDDERLIKLVEAPKKAIIEKKREQLLKKVQNYEILLKKYEKNQKEAGVDYFDYIILPNYKTLKKPFDVALSKMKSFNREYGYADDTQNKDKEFIRKNEPKIDRTELFKTAVSIAESRVKSAQTLLDEAKNAAAKTKAMRDLQTEQSSLAEANAYLKKLQQDSEPDKEKRIRIANANAKARLKILELSK